MTDTTAAPDQAVPTSAGLPKVETTRDTPAPGSGQDWTDQVTDLIVDTVDKVSSRTTGPILEIARGSVHAIVALVLAVPIAVLAMVLSIRVLTYFVFREVWITYAVLGTFLVLAGVVSWSRRRPRRA